MSNAVAQLNVNSREPGRGESWQQLLCYPVRELAALQVIETKKFRAGQPHDDRAGLALFALAIIQSNQEAWEFIYHQYSPLVLSWLRRSPRAVQLMARDGDATSLINGIFAKFFRAVTPSKLEGFSTLAALLKYLRCCANSVVADEVRSSLTSSCENPLDGVEQELATDDPVSGVLAKMQAQQVWQILEEALPSEEELWLLHQTFVRGMRPSEICESAPSTFPTVEDVYRIKRNVLERLRRNQRLRRAFAALN